LYSCKSNLPGSILTPPLPTFAFVRSFSSVPGTGFFNDKRESKSFHRRGTSTSRTRRQQNANAGQMSRPKNKKRTTVTLRYARALTVQCRRYVLRGRTSDNYGIIKSSLLPCQTCVCMKRKLVHFGIGELHSGRVSSTGKRKHVSRSSPCQTTLVIGFCLARGAEGMVMFVSSSNGGTRRAGNTARLPSVNRVHNHT